MRAMRLIGMAILLAASSSFAQAQEASIDAPVRLNTGSFLALELVRSPIDGEVQVRSLHRRSRGEILGAEPVRAGINRNVRIPIYQQLFGDVEVVLVGPSGQELAREEIDVVTKR